MARRALAQQIAMWGACLLTACSGGQTGQPNTSTCYDIAIPAEQAVAGVSPAQLAEAYVGVYHASLRWSGDAAALPAEDITITVSRATGDGQQKSCVSALSAPIQVEVRTSSGSVSELGATLLSAPLGALEPATFTLVGQHFIVEATFDDADSSAATVRGTLRPLAAGATSEVAEFSSN